MTIIQAILLGLVQGLTEFIPVSSSGHLLLLHHALGISEQGLAFDVALHIGTLAALLLFFYRDILSLVKSLVRRGPQTTLAYILAVATIPAVIAGLVLESAAETTFRSPYLVCAAMATVALFMIAAERYTASLRKRTELAKVGVGQGMAVGLAQALALVPGISRSGSTITAGLFAGMDRVSATRFSFLLAIPITFGAILRVVADGDTLRQISGAPYLFAVGIVTAFVSGAFAIRFLLKFVAKHNLNTFAYYRLALAVATVVLLIAV